MFTKLGRRFFMFAFSGSAFLLLAFFPAPTKDWHLLVIFFGFLVISSGVTGTIVCELKHGKLLCFDDLPKGKFEVLSIIEKTIVFINTVGNPDPDTNGRFLRVSQKFTETVRLKTASLKGNNVIVEVTNHKKGEFSDLNHNKLFLEGNTVIRIISQELAAIEVKKSTDCGCTA